MTTLSGISIRWKFFALVAFYLIGFGAFGVFSFRSLHTVEVNGPIYARIVVNKDLAADALPPPLYIIESYLTTFEMIDAAEAGADRSRLQYLSDACARLRGEYEERHAFWVKRLAEGELKQALTESSYRPAMDFYRAWDERFVPAILAGRLNEARAVRATALETAYRAHRAAIDRVIELAARSTKQEEETTARDISRTTTTLLSIGAFTAAISVATSALFARAITRPLSIMAGFAHEAAQGRLDPAPLAQITSRDEIGTLASAFAAMTRDLRKTLDEWQAKNAELERFTYVVSHDLRGPIITIKGFVGYVEQAVDTGHFDRIQEDLGRIGSAADKMQQLLGDLLELSRIGRVVNPPTPVPLGELSREAVALLAGRLQECPVEVDISPDLPVVQADRTRLLEVLQNLLENALKFMGAQPHPRVEVGVRQDQGENVFWVKDNGIGIEPRFHEKIFGIFEKLDPAGEGTGAGLAIVKRAVEAHGGRVWVESAGTGHGATFCFTLANAAKPDEQRGES